jgi:hypothetical protein
VAFLFDFERTIRLLQQGQEVSDVLMAQLVYFSELGMAVAFTPIINAFNNFVDYLNFDLPQADLHERILRQEVSALCSFPIPRLAYLPNAYRSVSSISHDVETGDPQLRPAVRASSMEITRNATRRNRRDTFFILMTEGDAGLLSSDDLRTIQTGNHTVTIHFDSLGATDFTPANFQAQSQRLRGYGIAAITGNRTHGLAWFRDYLALAIASQRETIYDSTFGGGPGYSHCGSVLPFRLYRLDGTPLESFEEISHGLMDVADSQFYFAQLATEGRLPLPVPELFVRAKEMSSRNDRVFNGVFDVLMHPVVVAGLIPPIPDFQSSLAEYMSFLDQEHLPSMHMHDVASWWRRRRLVSVGDFSWNAANQLTFSVTSNDSLDGVTLILPQKFRGRQLQYVSDGVNQLQLRPTLIDGATSVMLVLTQGPGSISLQAVFA